MEFKDILKMIFYNILYFVSCIVYCILCIKIFGYTPVCGMCVVVGIFSIASVIYTMD